MPKSDSVVSVHWFARGCDTTRLRTAVPEMRLQVKFRLPGWSAPATSMGWSATFTAQVARPAMTGSDLQHISILGYHLI